ncbi:phage capsid protein [Rickettsiella endosymbiont of Dermanyssus gallinae]|uniref:phage capsid protein n=1 Tax=Rickettsiella endosymbiont of Dermanyssus gallinae TaxID=2856608 RepID=UPI001FE3308A|nr:phage capsid protein [Rickettsiella endosymbiont of Dermanyssus gallinae]
MSEINLDTACQLFASEVTLQYQNRLKLQDTIEERHGLRGTQLNVPVSDLLEMNQTNFTSSDIFVTPVNETNVQVPTHDYHLKTVIGGGEKTLFNFDKILDHARLHAKAAARLTDYIKINAIFSDPAFIKGDIYTVPVDVGINTGLNEEKYALTISYLESQDVDVHDLEVSTWPPALLKPSLFADKQVTSSFYNDTKPLTNNKIKVYLDIDFRFMGQNGINSIPRVPDEKGLFQYLVPVVHKDAIIQGYNRDINTSITWLPNQDRWELLTFLTSGAKIIQPRGIALITANQKFTKNP